MEAPDRARLVHPKTILVATNLSDLQRLMPFALQMASETGARLQLLHVLPVAVEFAADPPAMPYYDRQRAFAEASNMLEPWCEHARKLGIHCAEIVRDGQPVAREILAVVNRFHPDRLILGTRSLGRLGKLLLGSVAEQVLRSVNLPVFTVGPEAHLQVNSGLQPTVLFATTLGEDHEANAALACQLASSIGARLVMLHVLHGSAEVRMNSSNALIEIVTYELQHLAHKVGAGLRTNVDVKVARGDPARQILTEAEANQADLIVMGAADHSMFDSITHDRTVCRVLAHAPCPVLSLHGSTAQQLESETESLAAH
jgi:nucleotide-binding universal stress UspA family protein